MGMHKVDCGVAAMVNYKNTFGRRCSAVESASGQCMFDYRSTEGRPCSGFFCNANGVDHDCAWCVYDRTQCNKAYPGGSCYHDRPMCNAPHSQDVLVRLEPNLLFDDDFFRKPRASCLSEHSLISSCQ